MRARAALEQVLAPKHCPECKGTGVGPHAVLRPYQCDGCNGTGIKGDPRLAAVAMLVMFVFTVVLPIYLWLW